MEVNRVDQVWAADITYIPMAKGFLYLVAIMDWHSRHVLAWKLSNTIAASTSQEHKGHKQEGMRPWKGNVEHDAEDQEGHEARRHSVSQP